MHSLGGVRAKPLLGSANTVGLGGFKANMKKNMSRACVKNLNLRVQSVL
jgi:hypothetical protein